jgi:regulator of RNase E activity RraA
MTAATTAVRLCAFGASTVSDALDQSHVNRSVSSLRRLSGHARPFAGRVITVELGAAAAAAVSHLGTSAIVHAEPGDVIVVANNGRTDCAGWGGILSAAARHRGIAGVVVDGAARDVDEAIALGLPIHARTATPTTARGRASEVAWGHAVTIDGVEVDSGDWVVADASGVVFVPAAALDDVLERAECIAAVEAELVAEVQRGRPVDEVMNSRYERMLAADARSDARS